jgi:hypothetical protein
VLSKKEVEIRWKCGMNGDKVNGYRVLMGKLVKRNKLGDISIEGSLTLSNILTK